MKTDTTMTATFVRPFTLLTSALLLGALSLGCVAEPGVGDEESEIDDEIGEAQGALGGWTHWAFGSTTNLSGVTISSNMACVLAGMAGNLDRGNVFGGVASEPSVAGPSPVSDTLHAHGGAYTNQTNGPVFINNPVAARATCFFATTSGAATWQSSSGTAAPKWITGLGGSNRQCFLGMVTGVDGSWSTSSRFARVVKVTATDATHPSTGWYIEGNLTDETFNGSHATIGGRCVDFPTGTAFTSGPVYSTEGGSTTVPIGLGMGSGIKACGLTGVTGAFNVNSFTDGAMITAPSTLDGSWTITVTNGKQATWACAK